MSFFDNSNTQTMSFMNNIKEKHRPRVLFRTSYGVVSIIDPDSIKRFQTKCGLKIDGKINLMTKAAIKKFLLDPSDIESLDKAVPIRSRRGSGLSTQGSEDLV